jgi:hypothetical protein
MTTIFLSHNYRDKDFVRRLAVDLQRLGGSVWLDEREMEIGDSIVAVVQKGIATADYVGVVLSPHSMQSNWVQREMEAAIAEENKTGRVKVLPLLLADCDIPPFLQARLHADFRVEQDYATELTKVARRLGIPESGTKLEPVSQAVSLQYATRSLERFADARQIKIAAITPAAPSPYSTKAFKARLPDGKGVLYCHATGFHEGLVFYVRKGIGWYYEYKLGGSGSSLGLPTSNEERSDRNGHPISFFEGGYIEWSPVTSIAKAVETAMRTNHVIGRRVL